MYPAGRFRSASEGNSNRHDQSCFNRSPHGDRIPYLELSEMWNGIIGLESNYEDELVVSNAKERGKDILAYKRKLVSIFRECSRILEKNGILAVMFNARSRHYWDSLQELEATSNLSILDVIL